MHQLAAALEQLQKYKIRGASDYAEILVAEALNGKRIASGVNRGFDVTALKYGRVEVKCRQLPPDGRIEERVQLGTAKQDGFDYLAVVIFEADFRVKGAVLVPYGEVWKHVTTSAYNRINYAQARGLGGAIDITSGVAAAAQR